MRQRVQAFGDVPRDGSDQDLRVDVGSLRHLVYRQVYMVLPADLREKFKWSVGEKVRSTQATGQMSKSKVKEAYLKILQMSPKQKHAVTMKNTSLI